MCETNKKCKACSIKESKKLNETKFEGAILAKSIGKTFKWIDGQFNYVWKKVEFSPITHTPTSTMQVGTGKGYEKTIFQVVKKDVIQTKPWSIRPPEKHNVLVIKVVSGPDPAGRGEYNIKFGGANKFAIVDILESVSLTDKIIKEAEDMTGRSPEGKWVALFSVNCDAWYFLPSRWERKIGEKMNVENRAYIVVGYGSKAEATYAYNRIVLKINLNTKLRKKSKLVVSNGEILVQEV